jgi:hypothetical protein
MTPEYEYMGYMLGELWKDAPLPYSGYTREDVFKLDSSDFEERYLHDCLPYKREVMKALPSEDIRLWMTALECISKEKSLLQGLDLSELDEEMFKKCVYMRNTVPSSTRTPEKSEVLSFEDVLNMPESQLPGNMMALEQYDMVYGTYGFGRMNDGTVIMKKDEVIYTLPGIL